MSDQEVTVTLSQSDLYALRSALEYEYDPYADENDVERAQDAVDKIWNAAGIVEEPKNRLAIVRLTDGDIAVRDEEESEYLPWSVHTPEGRHTDSQRWLFLVDFVEEVVFHGFADDTN